MSSTSQPAGRRLLAVFAHPDDESLAAGGLLALASDAGAKVSLLCLTRGEAAAGQAAGRAERERLAATRTCELIDAARVVGIADVMVLDHEDGMLPWLATDVLEADIRRALERIAPDVVVTFGPDGLYWHPDHIAVSERTTAAVAALGGKHPALFYATTPAGQMRAVAEAAIRRGDAPWIVGGLDVPDAFGADAQPPTLVVDVGSVAARKLAAIRCHRSQVAGGAFHGMSEAEAQALLGVEHYRRAQVGHDRSSWIDRFGVAPDGAHIRTE